MSQNPFSELITSQIYAGARWTKQMMPTMEKGVSKPKVVDFVEESEGDEGMDEDRDIDGMQGSDSDDSD